MTGEGEGHGFELFVLIKAYFQWKIAEFTFLLFIHGLLTMELCTNDTWFCFSRRRSDSARSNNFARSMCVSFKDQNKDIKRTASLLFGQHLDYKSS